MKASKQISLSDASAGTHGFNSEIYMSSSLTHVAVRATVSVDEVGEQWTE